MPPPGPRSLVSEADREQLLGLLREHYARGQLDLEEMRRRVGVVLASTYSDEAAAAVAEPSAAGQDGFRRTVALARPAAAGSGSGGATRSKRSQMRGGFRHRRDSATLRRARSCGSGSTPQT